MADPPPDPYATAKANLRDTVKWLAAALAGVAAVSLGSSPLTSLGSMPIAEWRFWVAIISLLAALLCFLAGIGRVLTLLISDVFVLEDARDDPALLEFVSKRHADLLPPEFKTLQSILDARKAAAETMWNERDMRNTDAYRSAKGRFDALAPALAQVTSLLSLERFCLGVRQARKWLICLAGVGTLALLVFAWAANPPKPVAAAGCVAHIGQGR